MQYVKQTTIEPLIEKRGERHFSQSTYQLGKLDSLNIALLIKIPHHGE